MKKDVFAIITADIIGFTHLESRQRRSIILETEELIQSWTEFPKDAAVFRGDSFQIKLINSRNAFNRCIQLFCWFRKYSENFHYLKLGVRISLGIGSIDYEGKSVLDSDGEAFHFSGRSFDLLGKKEFWTIKTSNEMINKQVQIILSFINILIQSWTENQAEVIYWTLENKNQQAIAEKLGIYQSAIHNRLKLSHWKEIEKGILYIQNLILNGF